MKSLANLAKATIAVGALLAPLAVVSSAAAETDPLPPVIVGDIEQLSTEEIGILHSDGPKRVAVDPYSGDITAVERLSVEELASLIEVPQAALAAEIRNSQTGQLETAPFAARANPSKPTWQGRPPALDYTFGLGTTNGSWPNRANFYTHKYYAKLCWANAFTPLQTYCMPERNGNYAWIEFGQSLTGKKVNLSTTRD